MNTMQTTKKTVLKAAQKVTGVNTAGTKYTTLSKKDALEMTAEVIEKYRPALKKLAE